MAQLVASVSVVVLGGVAEVMGSNLARGKIFTASIGSVGSLSTISSERGKFLVEAYILSERRKEFQIKKQREIKG